MCYRIIELYSACSCLYYEHDIDKCASYGRPGHFVQKRTIFVGYTCQNHISSAESYPDSGIALGLRLEATNSCRVPGDLPASRQSQDILSQQKGLVQERADELDEGYEEPSPAADHEISGGARQQYPVESSHNVHAGRSLSHEDITKPNLKTSLPSKSPRKDLVGLAAISLIEGDLKLLWRKIISQALSFEEALKIVRRHVSLHFSYLESLAITKTQRTLVITLKLVEKKSSAIIIEAIESNAESEDEASLKPSARLEGSQELLDRQGFLAHGQAIEELKARLKDTVTDESSSFPKSALTTYYAGIRNVLDRFSAKLTRACGTSETGGTPKAHIMEWTCPSCAIDLVKFELFRNELANVYDSAFSPVGSDFEYKQSDTEPPIGPNLMMHLFENPNHADIFPVLLRRIPRKTKERLRPCPKKGSSIGWGVQFKETLNGMYVFAFGCIGFMLCLVISVVYTLMKDDIQGGFAIGYMSALPAARHNYYV
ncbi:hypothetical protein CGCF413_v002577 [Colletotrichum fructicola]|nr:hypothetical protein CGCF413_v002577 [Colletotrichum fructicola]